MSGLSTEPDTSRQTPARQVRRLGLLGVPGAVGRARDFLAGILSDSGWAGPDSTAAEARERAEDVLLVVSELVGNALAHGGGVQELAVTVEGRLLTVGVTDLDAALPAPLPPGDPARPGGHGLHVVDLLSQRWGTTHHPSGKTVWAEFAR